jgi:hypothetical protein
MFLYKLEVQLANRAVVVIVMGDNDEEVMNEVKVHISKHYVESPEIKEIALVEKRRANKGSAYVIET